MTNVSPEGATLDSFPRRITLAWASYDWGTAAFNAVMTTFVFTAFYLVSDTFGGHDHASEVLGLALGVAGLCIALLAPVVGQRSDTGGRRRLWLGVHTGIVVILTASCFFVLPEPGYLLLGCALLAAGHVFSELASVNYNAMLLQISNSKNIGKISGVGWAFGYLGGIVLLLLLYFGMLSPSADFFGLDENTKYRVVALISAAWILIFSLPTVFLIPEIPSVRESARIGFFRSYAVLFGSIARMWKNERHTVYFLIASAIFRDGLAAVFTFGAVIARGTFGFTAFDVLLFAIAANVVAALGALSAGFFDDKLGPKVVIVISLVGLLVSAAVLLFAEGKTWFWIFGLALCLFVGPAQSSARTYVARLATKGEEGELFGLYATTGRAASFIAPTLFSACIALFGAQRYGIIGIAVVLLAGLLVLLPIKSPGRRTDLTSQPLTAA